MKKWLVIPFLLCLTACKDTGLNYSADDFKVALINSISNATKVELVEHAWMTDYTEENKNLNQDWNEEYKNITLDQAEVNELIQVIQNSKFNKGKEVTLYPKIPYHNCIKIYNGEEVSYLYVSSYWCDWIPSESNAKIPHTLPEDLRKFFERKGIDTSNSDDYWKNKLKEFLI